MRLENCSLVHRITVHEDLSIFEQGGMHCLGLLQIWCSPLPRKEGEDPSPRWKNRGSTLGIASHLTARRVRSSHALPREKKKAPGPCELRALLRDEPSSSMHEAWPKAHHQAPPDLAIRQRQLCSGARPSAQPKSLARQDRNRFRSLQGRVTSATPIPRYWTSCMTG